MYFQNMHSISIHSIYNLINGIVFHYPNLSIRIHFLFVQMSSCQVTTLQCLRLQETAIGYLKHCNLLQITFIMLEHLQLTTRKTIERWIFL